MSSTSQRREQCSTYQHSSSRLGWMPVWPRRHLRHLLQQQRGLTTTCSATASGSAGRAWHRYSQVRRRNAN